MGSILALQATAHVAKLEMDPDTPMCWMHAAPDGNMVHTPPEHPEAAFR